MRVVKNFNKHWSFLENYLNKIYFAMFLITIYFKFSLIICLIDKARDGLRNYVLRFSNELFTLMQ